MSRARASWTRNRRIRATHAHGGAHAEQDLRGHAHGGPATHTILRASFAGGACFALPNSFMVSACGVRGEGSAQLTAKVWTEGVCGASLGALCTRYAPQRRQHRKAHVIHSICMGCIVNVWEAQAWPAYSYYNTRDALPLLTQSPPLSPPKPLQADTQPWTSKVCVAALDCCPHCM